MQMDSVVAIDDDVVVVVVWLAKINAYGGVNALGMRFMAIRPSVNSCCPPLQLRAKQLTCGIHHISIRGRLD